MIFCKKLSVLCFCIALGGVILAQSPKTLTYQGRLMDASGPLNGIQNLVFTLYDSPSGGNPLWVESNSVEITNGSFSVILGKTSPINVQTDKPLWFGIKVGNNPEIIPRVEMTGSLYALGQSLPFSTKSDLATSLFSIEATGNGARPAEFIHSGTGGGQAALFAISTGGNMAFYARNSGPNERSAYFHSVNATSLAPNVDMSSFGLGHGLSIALNNASNTNSAVSINHAGQGNAITANRPIQGSDIIATQNLRIKGLTYQWPSTHGIGVLRNNGNGVLTWDTGSSGWGLTGSAGTIDGSSFIGTTDNVPLSFRVNNQKAGRIDHINLTTFLGHQAGNVNTGHTNTGLGARSLLANTSGVGNTAVGLQTLSFNTTGNNNTAIGVNALRLNSVGISNVALGFQSLAENTNGNNNTGVGYSSLYRNSTGHSNAALGYEALMNNLGGSENSAFGTYALRSNTVGVNNVAIGNQSLMSNVAGSNATAVGKGAMQYYNSGTAAFTSYDVAVGFEALRGSPSPSSNTGVFNTALGYQALQNNSSGFLNVAVGAHALLQNTTGTGNVAVGGRSLQNNTTGELNTAVGVDALLANANGSGNTAVGRMSMSGNTSGGDNTALGLQTLYRNTTGSGNIAIGGNALASNVSGVNNTAVGLGALNSNTGFANTALGSSSLQTNTSGFYNVAVGMRSLISNATGDRNTAIGYNALSTGTDYTNSTAIGYNAQVTSSNMIRLGDPNITSINGAVAFTVVSDGRFKTNLRDNVAGLSFIMKLRPVTYNFDMDEVARYMNIPDSARSFDAERQKEIISQSGFIAQQVEVAASEVGYDFSGIDKPENSREYYGLRYAEFVVPLVKAVQEQQEIIEELRVRVTNLENEVVQYQGELKKSLNENLNIQSEYLDRLKKLEEFLNVKAQADGK